MNIIKRIAERILSNEIHNLITASSRAAQADVLPHHPTQGVGLDWRPIDYGEYIAKSVPIYAAIRVRANAILRTPWEVYRSGPQNSRIILPEEHPARMILDQPNPWMSGADLRAATETYLCLYGMAFWTIEDSEDRTRKELWPVRPDKMTVLPGTGRRGPHIRGYIYRGSRGDIPYLPNEVESFTYFNPLQDRTGLSPIAPIRLPLDMAHDATRFNRNTFKNSATPDILLMAEQNMTDSQVEDFYRRWENRHKGPDKAHRPAILSDIKDAKQLSLSPRDMEYIESLRWTIKDAARIYGVPETMLAEIQFATLNNMDALQKAFWQDTMIPEALMFSERVTSGLLPKLGINGIKAELDFTNITILGESDETRLQREIEYLDRGVLTINEVRRSRGMDDVPWGNENPRRNQPQTTEGQETNRASWNEIITNNHVQNNHSHS